MRRGVPILTNRPATVSRPNYGDELRQLIDPGILEKRDSSVSGHRRQFERIVATCYNARAEPARSCALPLPSTAMIGKRSAGSHHRRHLRRDDPRHDGPRRRPARWRYPRAASGAVALRQRLNLRRQRTLEIALAMNLVPRFTPVESPESNVMAEALRRPSSVATCGSG